MLLAIKRKKTDTTTLAKGIQHLYLMNGVNTVFYMYECLENGEVELLQVQLFCPDLYALLLKQNIWEDVVEDELKAIWRAECAMITRARNKLKKGISSILV